MELWVLISKLPLLHRTELEFGQDRHQYRQSLKLDILGSSRPIFIPQKSSAKSK
jgi:hypothetical protein